MFDNLDDPRQQALLATALGLLGGRGKGFGGFMQSAGQAGLLGLNRYAVANEDKRRNASSDMQNKMLAEQYKQAQRSTEYQNNFDALARQHFNQGSPGVQPLTPNDDEGNAMPSFPPQAPKSDFQGFMSGLPALGGQGVKDAIALQQSMAKDSAFSKIDPKDYTPESIRRFAMSAQGGKPDFSILEPVRKREVVDGRVIDPYAVAPGSEVSGPQSGVVPNGRGGYMFNPAKINPVEVANFNLSRARAADEGVGGLPGIPGFMTGGVTGPIQRGPSPMPQSAPQGASMPPVAAPSGVPPGGAPMSPKQARAIAEKSVESLPVDMASYQSSTAALDKLKEATAALKDHPGLAGITGKMGVLPNMPGSNAANAQAKLETLKSQVAFGVLQAMRDASKTGGALGNVSDAEGKRLEANLAALDRAQSLPEFKQELDKIIKYADSSKTRLYSAMKFKHGEGAVKSFALQDSTGGEAPPAPPVKAFTKAEYDKLPPGSLYISPDGKTRRKP